MLITSFLIFAAFCILQSQTKSELAGMWKIVVEAGMKKTAPTYLKLNEDGTYIWGMDSTQADPNKSISKGTWDLTADNEITFISSEPSAGSYYTKRGDIYEYRGNIENGKKKPEITLDYSLYIQKCK